MNLFNLLTKEKHVAGIEINDSAIRVAFLQKKTTNKKFNIYYETEIPSNEQKLIILEEPLPNGIVSEGVVINSRLLASNIKKIWIKSGLNTNYAIIAIPDDEIYSRIFSFPKTLDKERLKEAMSIGVGFQLPMKTDEVYLDWEHVASTQTTNEVLMSSIPKRVADGYIEALSLAGIKPIALESHLASIARSVKIESDETTIFTKKNDDDSTIFILKEREVLFSRSIPVRFVPKTKFANEVNKIKLAFESDMSKDSKPISVIDIDDAKIRDEYANFKSLTEPKTKWLVAIGAAIRGAIPEGEDHIVSLLPVKTEEMYMYQKASTFTILVSNTIISISIFFTTVFLSVYFLMLYFSQTTNNSIANRNNSAEDFEIISKENSINKLNEVISTTKEILSITPSWSNLLEEIQKNIVPGITVSTLIMPSLTGDITLSGVAKDRNILNQFKKSLQDSQLFSSVILPINNLEQKENISFSFSLKIKDPGNFYYK